MELVAILENIRSLHNVGAIFRTADTLGVDKLYLTGQTGHPHPEASWRKDHQQLLKTSLGAEKTVPWEYQASATETAKQLKQAGFQLIALELTPTSQPLTTWHATERPVAVIVGNEMTGVSQELLTAADTVLHIPMVGTKESLNVSVAFGIVAFWLTQLSKE